MPHLILEYSANLAAPDLPALFAGLHEALATLGIALDDCKSRAYCCDAYRVGTGAPERAFAHLTLALLDRRPLETQRMAGELALQRLQDAFAGTALDCDLTVEVREIRSGCYFKARGSGPAPGIRSPR
jgi:5-carboxymethyl-2-hydroxymuconate isomerase